MKKLLKFIGALFLFVAIFVIGYTIFVFVSGRISEKNIVRDVTTLVDGTIEEARIEHPGTDSYYGQHSDVLTTVDATKSPNTQTEKEIQSVFKERGFGECEIFSEYSMNGMLRASTELTNEAEKHPTYQAYYVSSSGEIWTVSSINGQITAYPAMFNIQSELNAPVLYAETNTIISYDSVTNKFYSTIPYKSELIVQTVEKIDSKTLDELTSEKIREMCP